MSFPTITPDTDQLDRSFIDNRIILISDHMPQVKSIHISYHDYDRNFQNTIIDLFNDAEIDYRSKIFVFDSYMCFDDFSIDQSIFTNEWLFNSAVKEFIDGLPDWNSIPKIMPTKTVSAIMNKVRPNRLILSTLLANLFDLDNVQYSFSLSGASSPLLELKELLKNCDYPLDTSKILPELWYGPRTYISNVKAFSIFLYNKVFSSSAVSLITEPTFFENGCHLSEKTLMSVYSGHFMIWVGNYKAAECAEKLGLDVFSDIIDHSYQYIAHPGKRSVEAVLRNIDLLTNLELQTDLRNSMYDRLNNNLKLMRDLNKLNVTMRENFNSHNLDLYDYIVK
jgi:hypothetical protein